MRRGHRGFRSARGASREVSGETVLRCGHTLVRGGPGTADPALVPVRERDREEGLGAVAARPSRCHLTRNVPFIPAAAWPLTVQRKRYDPFFLNVTFMVWLLPGFSSLVVLPAILKS